MRNLNQGKFSVWPFVGDLGILSNRNSNKSEYLQVSNSHHPAQNMQADHALKCHQVTNSQKSDSKGTNGRMPKNICPQKMFLIMKGLLISIKEGKLNVTTTQILHQGPPHDRLLYETKQFLNKNKFKKNYFHGASSYPCKYISGLKLKSPIEVERKPERHTCCVPFERQLYTDSQHPRR